ncbi:MAG: choice-of-anchor J domain-containing protein [Prevotellaceae bacterium]|jgi:hypothetical protein|nr:choice-of-anchor J domain-containing protein [Prevotellaceae bacterium]
MKKIFFFLIALILSFSISYGQGCLDGQITLPYSEGFENGMGCWTAYDLDDNFFEQTPVFAVSNKSYMGVPFAHSGEYSCAAGFQIYPNFPDDINFTPEITQTALVSSKISIGTDVITKMSFWCRNVYSNTKVSVLVMTVDDAVNNIKNGNYTSIWGPRQYYDPSLQTQPWLQVELDLSAFAGQDIYLAFYYNGDAFMSHDLWFLDDINIIQLEPIDAGVTEIVSPETAVDMTANEQVTVKIKNFGQQPLNNIPVTLTLDGVTVASETLVLTQELASYKEAEFTFSQTVDLSAAGTYTIGASTDIAGDGDAANNSSTKQVRNYGHFEVVEFPHNEGFEDDETLVFWKQEILEYDSLPIRWIYATGAAPWDETQYISGAHSGERNALLTAYYDVPMALSQSRFRTKLISPHIHLDMLNTPMLNFWHAQSSDYGDLFPLDTLKIYYKTSADGEWQWLYTEERTLKEWTETTLALPDKTGDYYIAFEGVLDGGWDVVLDDIIVYEGPNFDAKMLEIIDLQTGFDMTEETVKVKLQNFGNDPLVDIPVKFMVNDLLVGDEIIGGELLSLADTVYTFSAKADLTEEQQYVIKAFTDVADDVNRANDTVTVIINNYVGKAVMGVTESVTTCNTDFYDNGIESNYQTGSSQYGYTEQMTFYPATDGKRLKASFEYYDLVPLIWWQGLPFPGDTLLIYEGATAAPERLLGSLTTTYDNTDETQPVFESSVPDGALTFVFHKVSIGADVAQGWKANITCVEPQNNDVGVKAIVAPEKAGSSAAQVKVEIQNYGSAPQSNFDIIYYVSIDGASDFSLISETFTGTIGAGEIAEFTFNTTVDLSVISEDIEIVVSTALANDENSANNIKSKRYISRAAVELSGFRLVDMQNQIDFGQLNPAEYRYQTNRFVTFNSNETETLNVHNAFDFHTHGLIVAGAFAHDSIFAYTTNISNNIIEGTPKNYIILDKNYNVIHSGAFEGIVSYGATPWFPADLTFDYSTNSLYGIVAEEVPSQGFTQYLLKFNREDGSIEDAFQLQYMLQTIAADKDGNLFGISSNGFFCSVALDMETKTGTVSPISHTGILTVNEPQSMTFDHNTNRLFWSVYENDLQLTLNLYEISLPNGEVHNFGRIGSGAGILGLYTPYDVPTAIDNNFADKQNIIVYPNPSDGKQVNISNVPQNSEINIFDLSGRMLKKFEHLSGNVLLKTDLQSGVYLIKVNETTRKLTVK